MKIIFKKIRYKNFLASGNHFLEIELNKHPNTLIIGSNGEGKSTFIDAITFSLFKKPFRNTNKPLLVNTINKKNCVVELEFSIGQKEYKIVRGIKPEIFEIYIDGKLKDQEGVWDYQGFLEKDILKLNYKVFTQIVVLSNRWHVPFMELPALDKRVFIENLLDIGIFSQMAKINKSKLQIVDTKLSKLKNDMGIIKDKISIHEKNLQEAKKDKQKIIDGNKSDIQKTEQEIITLLKTIKEQEEEIENIRIKIDALPDIEKKIKELNKYHTKIHQNLERVVKDKGFFEKNNNCPTCSQPIDSDFKQHQLECLSVKEQDFDKGLQQISDELSNASKVLSERQDYLMEIEQRNKDIFKIKQTIEHYKSWVQKLEKDNKELCSKSQPHNVEELESLNTEYQFLTDQYNKALEEKNYLEKISVMLKDNGIKTIIIKQYLPLINKSINTYLSYMDFFVNFSLNEEFEETIRSRYIDEFAYGNFSDGERLRINLAILFSWIHLAKVKNSIDTNLLIMDEILDSSLDPTGTEECLKLIQNFSKETNIFVLSPKPDQLLDKFPHVIRFQKKGNFSEIV